ncbi:MAG: DUF349 domain-containing protein, partial [Bacteroidales bacterium]|nr:DUF349 domain-containing protein [Bacteroidales bacterium]
MEETNKNMQPATADETNQTMAEPVPTTNDAASMEPSPDADVQPRSTDETQQEQPAEQRQHISDEPFDEPQVDYSAYSRQQLVDALKELLPLEIPQIRNRVLAIKQQFAEKTAAERAAQQPSDQPDSDLQPDSLSQEYDELYNQYRKKRQQHNHQLDEQKQHNLQQKNQLLDELRELINSNDTLKAAHDKFNDIQERWKSIGDVPRSEINNLWNNYHFLIEQFFAKVKINKELRDKDLRANLDQKISICEKTEALIMEQSVNKAFKQLQQYREQWREIGPVPSEQNEEI